MTGPRLERLEKARVARLLAQARALREAQEIRAYVSAVRDAQSAPANPMAEAELQNWADWAFRQADRGPGSAAGEPFKMGGAAAYSGSSRENTGRVAVIAPPRGHRTFAKFKPSIPVSC